MWASEMAAGISVAVTMINQPMSGHPMWKDAIFGSADITQQSRTSELVSLFLWNGCSTSIFHGSLDLDNTQLKSLLNITGVIYTVCSPNIDCCSLSGQDKCGQCEHSGQHRVSSSEFQHRADHVSPPVLWHDRKQHSVRLLAGLL